MWGVYPEVLRTHAQKSPFFFLYCSSRFGEKSQKQLFWGLFSKSCLFSVVATGGRVKHLPALQIFSENNAHFFVFLWNLLTDFVSIHYTHTWCVKLLKIYTFSLDFIKKKKGPNLLILFPIISQTSNTSSSGSKWAKTKTKTFLECNGQNFFRTVEKRLQKIKGFDHSRAPKN